MYLTDILRRNNKFTNMIALTILSIIQIWIQKAYGITGLITARNTVTSSIHVSQVLECLVRHEGSLLIMQFLHIPTIMVPLIILALLEGRA